MFHFQVSEERLISLIEQINTQTTKQTKVTVSQALFGLRFLVLFYCPPTNKNGFVEFSDSEAQECT